MAVTANSAVTPQTPKVWTSSIGNSDAQNWRKLVDNSFVGPGTNGAKITGLWASSTDGTARDVQLAIARQSSITVTSATPGVISWANNNLSIGDQFFMTAATMPTGTTAFLPYFVISGGFSFNTSLEFATSAGGSAVATSSTGTTVLGYSLRILGTASAAITAGTISGTPSANFLSSAYIPGVSVDNDGNPYLLLESTDFLVVAAAATVTSNKIINVFAQGANF